MNKPLSWLLFILLSLTWGSSFILMKRGLEVFTSVQVACLRICFASVFLLPFAVYHFKKAQLKANWKYILVVGLFGNFFPAFLFTRAQTGISSSMAGILNSLTPLFTLLLAILGFKKTFNKWQVIGVFVGLAGAFFLLTSTQTQSYNTEPKLGWLVVLATFFYAISVNVLKHFLAEVNSIAITSFAFMFVFGPALFILFQTGFFQTVFQNANAPAALGYIGLLGIWGTAVAVILYNVLIKNTNVLFASSVTYFIPVVALFWGIADGEGFYLAQIISILMIIVGVYLVNFNPRKS